MAEEQVGHGLLSFLFLSGSRKQNRHYAPSNTNMEAFINT